MISVTDSHDPDKARERIMLNLQMKAFKARGGKIQQIPAGVSGQVAASGPRHITLGSRSPAKAQHKG